MTAPFFCCTMADCGATGSAIDRSTRLISSAILGQNSGTTSDATARAGKAISSFLGTASVPVASSSTAVGLLPPAPPDVLLQQHSLGLINTGGVGGETRVGSLSNRNHGMNPILINNRDVNSTIVQRGDPIMHHHRPPHPQILQYDMNIRQSHADVAQMQRNINMMNQQMAMMQMTQLQQRQIIHQQHAQNNVQRSNNKNKLNQQDETVQINDNSSLQRNDLNAWHENVEEDFQSYLDTYGHGTITDDANSTHTENEYGHEGHTEAATIEKLAAAWAEAEQEYLENDDYTNFASSYGEYDGFNGVEVAREYTFSTASENFGLQEGSEKNFIDLISEGKMYFDQGKTKDAINCFESHLRNVDPDSSEAWLMLGKCNAENDEDRKAIACLENAIERDPYSTEGLLSLGVSYVNELNYDQALKHLSNWVTHNPNIDVSIHIENNEMNALDKVKTLLVRAKEFSESHGNEESIIDVLEALGVIYNVSREYEDAVECFQAASTMRPRDYQLWNKLGATLANNQRSEEAQNAYQKALSIKPKYARAWLNMAIAHSNLQNHDEAARCYLQTLSLNPGAVHIWSYLRISLTCSEKWDLLPFAASQNISAFKEHYDFVQY